MSTSDDRNQVRLDACASQPKRSSIPSEAQLATRIAYDPSSGLPTERSLPAKPGGGDAHTTKIVYYTTGKKTRALRCEECETTGAWVDLPCKIFPAGQPETPGQPELLVTKYVSYSPMGQPTKVVESPGGSTQNTRTNDHRHTTPLGA